MKRWNIGGRQLDAPVVLAPMAGVTNAAFRQLCREQGAALTVTEMVMAQALVGGHSTTRAMAHVGSDEHPISVQLCGTVPSLMAEAARLVEADGADAVDINMGCPAPKICRTGCGAALPRDLNRAEAVVSAVSAAVRIPVTVKLRAGWDRLSAPETARRLAGAGARAIAVHCRTRFQIHSGAADWRVVAAVREATPDEVPVIANGDVRSGADARRLIGEYGADMVMVARGALGNPWVFHEIREDILNGPGPARSLPSFADKVAMVLRHLELLVRLKGEHIAVLEMRRHSCHYLRSVAGAAQVRRALCSVTTANQLTEEVMRLSESVGLSS